MLALDFTSSDTICVARFVLAVYETTFKKSRKENKIILAAAPHKFFLFSYKVLCVNN